MGIMHRLDDSGHRPIARWSDDRASQVEAERVFNSYVARHYTLTDITTREGTVMRNFDPAAKEILAVPAMKGG